MTDEEKERRFREFVKMLNSELLPCDEEAILAVYAALREAYGLDAYPTPAERKRRDKAVSTADKADAKNLKNQEE